MMLRLRSCLIVLILTAPLAGCGASPAEAPRDSSGLVPLPERPGPSQAEQKANYLKRSKEAGRPRG